MADHALQLSDDEVARYRLMAEQARDQEGALWAQAGVASGARIADVGCGPGAILAMLAAAVGARGEVIGIDGTSRRWPPQRRSSRRPGWRARRSGSGAQTAPGCRRARSTS